MQLVHNEVFQKISTEENELSFFDMVNVKRIVYNIGALETTSKDNKILEFQEVSLKDNTAHCSMPITFYSELTQQLKEGKRYEITEVRITKYASDY